MKRTLPKKWCIERNTINYLAVNKWLNSTHKIGEGEYTDKRGWAFSERVSAGSHGRTDTDGFAPAYPAKSKFTPIIFEEFKKFVLKEAPKTKFPAKWCILRTPTNAQVLNDWANKTITDGGFTASEGWFYSGMKDWNSNKPVGHTTITIEQFKKHVANKPKTTRRTGPSKVAVAPVAKSLPDKYVVSVSSKMEEDDVATQLKENKWVGIIQHNYVIWDKNYKGTALWDTIPFRAFAYPIFTYSEWKELYYPKSTTTTSNKVTIEEIVARPTKTWIRCTSVEQGRKIGEYYFSDGKGTWEDFNFDNHKEFLCYPFCKNESRGGWNPKPCDDSPIIDFNDVIFPIKATLPTENFGIIAESHPKLVLSWFKDNGYNTSRWNGNAEGDYIYFVQKGKKVDCNSLAVYKNDIKGTIFTLTQIKEMTQKTQKIIGYKAPSDLFKGRIKKGDIFSEYSPEGFVMYCKAHGTSGVPTEIVQSWEPVYEEVIKSKVVNLGTPKRKFTIFKDKVEVVGGDDKTRIFTKEQVETIAKMFTSCTVRSLTTKVKSVQVGCDDGTSLTLDDIETIRRTQSLL